MSYTKNSAPFAGIAEAVTTALQQNNVDAKIADALVAAGTCVTLETGAVVWVSCVVDDKPETPQIDFLTVVIAAQGGSSWLRANGQPVSRVFWHGIWPEALASMGIDTVRRALMMVALGEPQPQIPIPSPDPAGPTEQDVFPGVSDAAGSRGIRTAISAANDIAGPLSDVL